VSRVQVEDVLAEEELELLWRAWCCWGPAVELDVKKWRLGHEVPAELTMSCLVSSMVCTVHDGNYLGDLG
jgi:hypothetical protein